jgi:hypothetical protein
MRGHSAFFDFNSTRRNRSMAENREAEIYSIET